MTDDERSRVLFIVLSSVVSVSATVGADIAGALAHDRRPMTSALGLWTMLFMLPPFVIGMLCGDLARLQSIRHAFAFFLLFEAPLLVMHFNAYSETHRALRDGPSVAASMIPMFLLMKTIVLLLGSSAVWIFYRLRD